MNEKDKTKVTQAEGLLQGLRALPISDVAVADASLIPHGDYCFSDRALRLVTVLSGRRRMEYAQHGQRVVTELRPGKWLMLLPHAPMWPQLPCRCHFVGFRCGVTSARVHASRHPAAQERLLPYLGLDMPPLPKPAPAIEAALLDACGADQVDCRCGLVTALLPVFADALKQLVVDDGQGAVLLRQICRYVQEHLHRGVDRNSTARHFGLAPSSLSRMFGRNGMAFNAYVNELRVDMAKQLLRSADTSIAEVAAACGFGSSSYFIKRFKQAQGCTPQQWCQRGA